ncbi:MAG: patatin-like phospholipase family protein [Alkalimonas sp.]|nr:patatin-like phospholipase family protein [Alkalimonas sp.]
MSDKQFQIGLTMAGAISAGAYTAGVIDYLLFALQCWEDEKTKNSDNEKVVPDHQVVISVISGASAGALTGALAFPLLASGFSRQHPHCTLPRLYDAWVRYPRFIEDAAILNQALLNQNDLEPDQPARSALDSTLLDHIVQKSFCHLDAEQPAKPYIAEKLHLFFSHTNLRGVPYLVRFSGALGTGYPMTLHADRAHFVLEGLGATPAPSAWADSSQHVTLSIKNLHQLNHLTEKDPNWQHYANAALLSGAFPVGLAAINYDIPTLADYQNRRWPLDSGSIMYPLQPELGEEEHFSMSYTGVDGGMLDNEPFELTRWALMKKPPKANARKDTKTNPVDRAVIMVDPFPESGDFPEFDGDNSLLSIIKQLLPTLKNQARCKPDEAIAALDESVFSRYLIAPIRYQSDAKASAQRDEHEQPEPHPIACGLTGGFGGFLHESFRHHDYQLGRLNCYHFLKHHFAMPEAYKVVAEGYQGCADLFRFTDTDAKNKETTFLPVIPLVGDAAQRPSVPEWPRIPVAVVEQFADQAFKRYKTLKSRLIDSSDARITRWYLKLGLKTQDSTIRDMIFYAMLQDLLKRDQLKDWGQAASLTQDERLVLAALATTKYQVRTAEVIAQEVRLPVEKVRAILDNHSGVISGPDISKNGQNYGSYCLRERRLPMTKRLPLIRNINRFFVGGFSHDLAKLKQE